MFMGWPKQHSEAENQKQRNDRNSIERQPNRPNTAGIIEQKIAVPEKTRELVQKTAVSRRSVKEEEGKHRIHESDSAQETNPAAFPIKPAPKGNEENWVKNQNGGQTDDKAGPKRPPVENDCPEEQKRRNKVVDSSQHLVRIRMQKIERRRCDSDVDVAKVSVSNDEKTYYDHKMGSKHGRQYNRVGNRRQRRGRWFRLRDQIWGNRGNDFWQKFRQLIRQSHLGVLRRRVIRLLFALL